MALKNKKNLIKIARTRKEKLGPNKRTRSKFA